MPAMSGSSPSSGRNVDFFSSFRSARRSSFSFCFTCLARSRARFASVALPGLAMVPSSLDALRVNTWPARDAGSVFRLLAFGAPGPREIAWPSPIV